MKANRLLALGVAGAFACSAASAATYLCTKDPADPSSLSCEKAPRDDRAYGPAAGQSSAVPSSASVAYSQMVAGAASDATAAGTASAKLRTTPLPSLATYSATRTDGDGS